MAKKNCLNKIIKKLEDTDIVSVEVVLLTEGNERLFELTVVKSVVPIEHTELDRKTYNTILKKDPKKEVIGKVNSKDIEQLFNAACRNCPEINKPIILEMYKQMVNLL